MWCCRRKTNLFWDFCKQPTMPTCPVCKFDAPANDTDASDEGPYVYNVTMLKWLRIMAHEVGDTTNPETLGLLRDPWRSRARFRWPR